MFSNFVTGDRASRSSDKGPNPWVTNCGTHQRSTTGAKAGTDPRIGASDCTD
jgi:hypothetical protein